MAKFFKILVLVVIEMIITICSAEFFLQIEYGGRIFTCEPDDTNQVVTEEKPATPNEGSWETSVETETSTPHEDIKESTPEMETTEPPKRRPTTMSKEEQRMYVEIHNELRAKVSPPAANMEYMEWDDRLAEYAQAWADRCIWEHGNFYDNDFGTMGQNLYRGGYHLTPQRIGRGWFSEYEFYDFYNNTCKPLEQCGHYTQMVDGRSKYVGCGKKIGCFPEYPVNVVCNYLPVGNIIGMKPYEVGKPCTRCPKENGGFCSNNMCVTKSQCEENQLECECKLECQNCGVLNNLTCTCECMDGWHSSDCTEICKNDYPRRSCHPMSCDHYNRFYKNQLHRHPCKATCGFCKAVDNNDLSHTCCNGKPCPAGSVLKSDGSCECEVLCPGPNCDPSSM